MDSNLKRRQRETNTLQLMISIYCKGRHSGQNGDLCNKCVNLLEYACERMARCPKGSAKRSCRVCEIHCYSPLMRTEIREVMRYSGPRMLYKAPLKAIRHLLNELGL